MTWVPTPGMTPKQIEKELNRQAILFEEQVKMGGPRVNGDIRFQSFSERFMEDHIKVNRKPNTVARYERDLRRINDALGHKKLSQITPLDITSFAASMQADGAKSGGGKLASSSVNTILRTLSAALGYAVKWGYISSNPALKAEGPGQEYSEAAFLDEAEARLFLQALQNQPIQWRALICCDLLSGLRRGELLGLQWPDVDFYAHLVYIRRTWNYTSGKGCYFASPKSARSRRPVHLPDAFFVILEQYKHWQDEQRAALGDAWQGDPDDPRVFTSSEGLPFFPTTPTWWLSKFTKNIGIKHLSIHSLRHTYASLMIADDVPIVEVSSQMGHAKTSTTTNIYGHVIAASHAKALRTLDKFDDILLPLDKKPEVLGLE
jgi:integrase